AAPGSGLGAAACRMRRPPPHVPVGRRRLGYCSSNEPARSPGYAAFRSSPSKIASLATLLIRLGSPVVAVSCREPTGSPSSPPLKRANNTSPTGHAGEVYSADAALPRKASIPVSALDIKYVPPPSRTRFPRQTRG